MVRSLGEVFLHLLVAGHALKPAERRDHAEVKKKLSVLLHLALQKNHALRGIEPSGQIVEHHFFNIVRDLRSVRVVGGECVPVGDEEVAVVLVLQFDPVGERAHVVAQVQLSRGSHAA